MQLRPQTNECGVENLELFCLSPSCASSSPRIPRTDIANSLFYKPRKNRMRKRKASTPFYGIVVSTGPLPKKSSTASERLLRQSAQQLRQQHSPAFVFSRGHRATTD
jgi:hypothetical protein